MTPVDLAVVGGGFWGKAVALVARRHGWNVVVVDDAREGRASMVAAGYFAHGWWKKEWRDRMAQALETAEFYGVDIARTGLIIANKDGKVRHDWYCFHPHQFLGLVNTDLTAKALKVGTGFVELASGRFAARRVLVAAGAFTDTLLVESGLPPLGVVKLGGSAVLYRGEAGSTPVSHQVNPFFAYNVRRWDRGVMRVGETLERKPAEGAVYTDRMLKVMQPYVAGWERSATLWGVRPLLPTGPKVVEVGQDVWVATGGGRTGAIMSFWAARVFLERFGFSV